MHFLLALFLACAAPSQAVTPDPEFTLEVEPTIIEVGPISAGELLVPTLQLTLTSAPVVMVIDSPGGSVSAGLVFIEAMRDAQRRGIDITCYVPERGMAASMAAVVFQACDTRIMHRQSVLLFHSVSIGSLPGGTVDDVERFAREMRDINTRLAVFVAGRLAITLTEYLERTKGDWWVGYEEASQINAVDEVVE